jgi:hypothetical protein
MKVAVVILNFNGRQHLETFLPSVIKHSGNHDIVVADNASTDDSISFLEQHYPNLNLIVNESNGGFAKGYNDALKQVEADIYVLLNSDVEVTENWIDPIVLKMSQNPEIKASQPKILSYKKKDHFEHAGACGGYIDKNYFPFCRGRIFHVAEKDVGQYNEDIQVFWATGACLFIRSESFHENGGFDEDFFAHMEEIDLCWRIQNTGGQIWCFPEAHVYHLGGGTLTYMSPKKTYLNFRNNLYMIHKNHKGNLFFKMFFRLFLDGQAGIKFLLGGQFSHCWAVFKAHMHYYRDMINLNKKRKSLKKQRNARPTSIYQGNILWSFFFKKNQTFSTLDLGKFDQTLLGLKKPKG